MAFWCISSILTMRDGFGEFRSWDDGLLKERGSLDFARFVFGSSVTFGQPASRVGDCAGICFSAAMPAEKGREGVTAFGYHLDGEPQSVDQLPSFHPPSSKRLALLKRSNLLLTCQNIKLRHGRLPAKLPESTTADPNCARRRAPFSNEETCRYHLTKSSPGIYSFLSQIQTRVACKSRSAQATLRSIWWPSRG